MEEPKRIVTVKYIERVGDVETTTEMSVVCVEEAELAMMAKQILTDVRRDGHVKHNTDKWI